MNPTLRRIDAWRTDRYERARAQYARTLPGWHDRRGRRGTVVLALVLLAALWAAAVATYWTPWAMIAVVLLVLGALAAMWLVKVCSEDVTDAPRGALDEFEAREKDAARAVGYWVFWIAGFVPYLALLFLAGTTGPYPGSVAYLGAFLVASSLMTGALSPILLAAWTKKDAPQGDPYLGDRLAG